MQELQQSLSSLLNLDSDVQQNKVQKSVSNTSSQSNNQTAQQENYCRICQKKFDSKYTLKTHQRTAHKFSHYKCQKCLKAFQNDLDLNWHMIYSHSKPKSSKKKSTKNELEKTNVSNQLNFNEEESHIVKQAKIFDMNSTQPDSFASEYHQNQTFNEDSILDWDELEKYEFNQYIYKLNKKQQDKKDLKKKNQTVKKLENNIDNKQNQQFPSNLVKQKTLDIDQLQMRLKSIDSTNNTNNIKLNFDIDEQQQSNSNNYNKNIQEKQTQKHKNKQFLESINIKQEIDQQLSQQNSQQQYSSINLNHNLTCQLSRDNDVENSFNLINQNYKQQKMENKSRYYNNNNDHKGNDYLNEEIDKLKQILETNQSQLTSMDNDPENHQWYKQENSKSLVQQFLIDSQLESSNKQKQEKENNNNIAHNLVFIKQDNPIYFNQNYNPSIVSNQNNLKNFNLSGNQNITGQLSQQNNIFNNQNQNFSSNLSQFTVNQNYQQNNSNNNYVVCQNLNNFNVHYGYFQNPNHLIM